MGQRSWEKHLCQTWGIQRSSHQEVLWISDLKKEQEFFRGGENRKNVLTRKKKNSYEDPEGERAWYAWRTEKYLEWPKMKIVRWGVPRAEARNAREDRWWGLCKHEGFDQGNTIGKLSPVMWIARKQDQRDLFQYKKSFSELGQGRGACRS